MSGATEHGDSTANREAVIPARAGIHARWRYAGLIRQSPQSRLVAVKRDPAFADPD
jgi:hypothetical protein